MTGVPEQKGQTRRSEVWAVLLLLAAAALPRLIALAADPAPDRDIEFLYDEGLWLHNARNHVLFGAWVLDEQHAALGVTPLYTAVLALVYRVLGVGFAQTRLLAGLSGILTVLVLYAALRARVGLRQALAPALVLSLSYFTVTSNRVGLPESFQLLLATAAAAGVLLAVERPVWGVLGGAGFVLCQLAKPSAALLGPVFVAFWAFQWHRARRGDGSPPWRAVATFAGGAALAALVSWFTVVGPHWALVRQDLAVSLATQASEAGGSHAGVIPFFGLPGFGFRFGGFFQMSVVPLALVVLLLVGRLSRAEQRPLRADEMLGWAWLVIGLGFIGLLHFQRDRRFLILMPAVALLAGRALAEGGIWLPARQPEIPWWRRAAAGAAAGALLGLYLQRPLLEPLRALAAGMGLEAADGLSTTMASSAIWSATVLLLAGLAVLAWPWLPRHPLRLPSVLAVGLFLLTEPARLVLNLSRPTYTMRDASRALGELTRDWDRRDKVMVGGMAVTLAQENDLFAFPIRSRPELGLTINGDGWERFAPAIAVVDKIRGKEDDPPPREVLDRGYRLWRRFGILPGPKGKPRWFVTYYVRPDLCRGCSPAP